jgi:hypothetical protein
MTTATATRARSDRQAGPSLLVPAAALTGLTVFGAVFGGTGPRPDWTAEQVLAYTVEHPAAISFGAALLLGSTIPLLVYAATLVRRMRQLGVQAPGPLMGLTGAVLAAAALLVSALAGWTAAQTAGLGDAALVRALTTLWFGAGGVGFVAPFGLLVLGIAVPALIAGLLPRAVAWAAAVVGVLAVLSTFALATDVLYPLLPIGRFGGLAVLIATALLLPTSRR